MHTITKQIQLKVFDSPHELDPGDQELLNAAEEAALRAYAPYSGFQVGAAVLLEGGIIVTGNNQENMAYPSGLCAERVAVFSASATHPGKAILKIAIIGHSADFTMDEPVTPCGACRQVLVEYENMQTRPIELLLGSDSGKVWVVEEVKHLIPFVFRAEGLKRKS